jgi:Raf kinase inhibitor-like YbhB/YbcL family protein
MSIIKKRNIILIVVVVVIMVLIIAYFFIKQRKSNVDPDIDENITITSNAFKDGGTIPIRYTGKGEDVSPDLELSDVSPEAKSIAVIMDDLDFPLGVYNHWVIWNIPVTKHIPEAISHGETVSALNGATQGIGYGKNMYKGPNPPFGSHRYKFKVYVLDTMIDLDSSSRKKDLIKKMEGHILQYGSITGKYK